MLIAAVIVKRFKKAIGRLKKRKHIHIGIHIHITYTYTHAYMYMWLFMRVRTTLPNNLDLLRIYDYREF